MTAIDRAARTVSLVTGECLAYDHLILATGSDARSLPVPGHNLAGIVELRTLADADRLRTLLCPGARIVIIGAGYIGLEVAASARMLGADVVVIEREPRVLARVASPPLAEFFHRHHTDAGVRIILNATMEEYCGIAGRVAEVRRAEHGRRRPRQRRLHPSPSAPVQSHRPSRKRAERARAGQAGRGRSVRPRIAGSRGAVVLVRPV